MFILLVCGCGTPTEVDTSQSSIIGGTNDTGDDAVVLVIAAQPGSNAQSICTGEVISPHVVLTAAHCVAPSSIGNGNVFEIFLGNDINNSAQIVASNFVAVKETHYDTAFNINKLNGGHDVGILITTTALPLKPIPFNHTALTSANVGQTVRFVGYGIDNARDLSGRSAGTKRQTSAAISGITSTFINFNSSTHGTCEGDSGGPAFLTVGGQSVIAGLTSFGPYDCSAGTDTRVDVYASFIDQYVAADTGTTPPPPPSCSHAICASGSQLTASCDPCASKVCAADAYCCTTGWDNICVREVATICKSTCP